MEGRGGTGRDRETGGGEGYGCVTVIGLTARYHCIKHCSAILTHLVEVNILLTDVGELFLADDGKDGGRWERRENSASLLAPTSNRVRCSCVFFL